MDKKSFIPLTINQRLKLQSPPPSSTSLLRRFQLGKPLRKLNYSISVLNYHSIPAYGPHPEEEQEAEPPEPFEYTED